MEIRLKLLRTTGNRGLVPPVGRLRMLSFAVFAALQAFSAHLELVPLGTLCALCFVTVQGNVGAVHGGFDDLSEEVQQVFLHLHRRAIWQCSD